MTAAQILWFRQDLRLADQPALLAALDAGPVLPVYVLDDETPGPGRAIGGAGRWWLHHSLAALDADLRARGNRLLLLRGRCDAVLPALMDATGASALHAMAHYEPWWQAAEVALGERLRRHGQVTLVPPSAVTSGGGGRYRIFTPFARAHARHLPPPRPTPAPAAIPATDMPAGLTLADLALLPTRPNWAGAFEGAPGEAGATAALKTALGIIAGYGDSRNRPSDAGTSRLSAHLHWGELSPAAVWHAATDAAGDAAAPFTRQIVWRDFAQGLIDSFPDSHAAPHRAQFGRFAHADVHSAEGHAALEAWRRGHTGYPIVDAGMRQLWATGWMHNRVRMIAASFLVKHLLIDWREGERWFWDTLVDADLANNALGWQWIMGSGVDSSPFNRIFAPVGQSGKFAAAPYIRRWVPELAALDDAAIHAPWEVPPAALRAAGVALGRDYPEPIVGHEAARARALAAYAAARA